MANGKIHIGTSGWSYKHWRDIFYPAEVKPADYLSYYADRFKVSELNTSFYRLPLKSTVTKWITMVPEGFLFCPKMSRYLSHLKKLHDPEEPLQRFFDIFDPIEKHLGPILVQLPASLRFNPEIIEHLYQVFSEKYASYRFAMEVRHDSWFSEESLSLMKKHKVTLVFAQSERFPYLEEVTAKDIFFRFHGPTDLYSSSYPDSALEEYARKFFDWSNEGHTIWAFFNNDVNGHAFRNAAKLQEYIDKLA
ncbi:DUF72 domain-containing protein [Dyadobacter sp. CY323]|uniref:DUF72 domain-containing protein n=1 Tax=Dyadobacter sp. CY323 TaxID=2907302 RepID=UPI001F2DB421|nr:DUF72 domain-containing protein [Dyadobacter sp. CY323]MCE6987820.1 DUF72 domain-containing protein [Dyadobacter sp. CY323]